jgi:hypothetical protein
LIKLIKKKIEKNPRRWHEVLFETLWAHRISRHGATKVTPFELVYGQEAVLPVEVNLDAYRLAKQNDLSAVMYHNCKCNQALFVGFDDNDHTIRGLMRFIEMTSKQNKNEDNA